MKTKLKILITFSFVLTFAFGGLWLREQNRAGALVNRNQDLVHDNIELSSALEGQRQANEDLRKQLETRSRLPEIPTERIEDMRPAFVQLPPVRFEEEFEGDEVVTTEEGGGSELSEEELARREEEQEARRVAQAERRAAWEERRRENRERVVDATQERRAFFEQISLDGLAPEYRDSHQRLLNVMDEVEEMMAMLDDPETDRDAQRELRRNFGGMMREVNSLMGTQREILLNDFAQALGYNGDDARDFIDYIETVNEMTSMGNFMRGRRGGGPPRN